MSSRILQVKNGEAVEARAVPRLSVDDLQGLVADVVTAGGRVAALYGREEAGELLVTAVLPNDREGTLGLLSAPVTKEWPSLAPECPAVQLFERELAEQYGVVPRGHPWPKPVRFEHRLGGAGPDAFGREGPRADIPGGYPFFAMEGEEVHEVAVGPVHAGIIEPGHFRFQCHGEHVFHLEIVLGYQHRGAEGMLVGGPTARTVSLLESVAGDTAVGNALCHARAMEGLAGVEVPPRAAALRAVALELERLANHVGDLGALATDIGFLPTASYCGALRADFLNALAEICGNRFGRGLVVPGGVRFDLPSDAAARLAGRMEEAFSRVEDAAGLFFDSPSSRNRVDGTGVVPKETAQALGLLGPAGRASGLQVDARKTHPFEPYSSATLPMVTLEAGDVHARARIRFDEARASAAFVVQVLRQLPEGPVRAPCPAPRPGRLAVSLVEGWRGELVHAVTTGADGRFARYKLKDPSFHNWMGLQLALRGEQISDFPLCNKSFNLSYCGYDL
ncbi:MAG: hydrogenase [Deltaproteobacteria bacterium]|nr:hydrogenase [Deltaproteobacteria bacterium]